MLTPNPYPGPRPFDPSETHLFFGRAAFIQELVDLVQTYPVTLLYGRSGTGKTSLVRAGLEQAVRVLGVQPTYVRLAPNSGVDADCFVASLRAALGLTHQQSGANWTTDIVSTSDSGAPDTLRLVIIDQAEELFLAQGGVTAGCRRVIHQLADRTTRMDDRLAVLFVFREEALAGFDELSAVLPHGTGIRLRLAPLDRESAAEAVCKPASAVGSHVTWTNDAVAMICESVMRKDGSIDALVLQCVCHRVWQECEQKLQGRAMIGRDDVDRYGSITDALRVYVREAVNQVSIVTGRPSHVILAAIEEWFVLDGQRKPLVWQNASNTSKDDLAVVDSLVATRLLTERHASESSWFELSHEGLVASVMREAEAQDPNALLKRALEAQARRWAASRHSSQYLLTGSRLQEGRRIARFDGASLELRQFVQRSVDRRRRRNVKRGVGILLLVMVSVLGLVVAAFWQENRALADIANTVEWLQTARNRDEAQLRDRAQVAADVLRSIRAGGSFQGRLLQFLRAGARAVHIPLEDRAVDIERHAERLRLALAASMPWDDGITRWRAAGAVSAVMPAQPAADVLLGTTDGAVYRLGDLGRPLVQLPQPEPVVAITGRGGGVLAIGSSGVWMSLTSGQVAKGHAAQTDGTRVAAAASDRSGVWLSLDNGRVCRVQAGEDWTCSAGAEIKVSSVSEPSIGGVVLKAGSDQGVLRYSMADRWVDQWSLRSGILSAVRVTFSSKIQSVTSWPGFIASGSANHFVEIVSTEGRPFGKLKTDATPTALEVLRGAGTLVAGTYKGQVLVFNVFSPFAEREPECRVNVSGGGRTTDPVVSIAPLTTGAPGRVVIVLTKSGLASVVDSHSCAVLQQIATGLGRIDDVAGGSGLLTVAVSSGSDVATVDPDALFATAASLDDSAVTVTMAGALRSTWPVLLRKVKRGQGHQEKELALAIVGPTGRPLVTVSSSLFRGEEPLESIAVSSADHDYLIVATSKRLCVISLTDIIANPESKMMFVSLEPAIGSHRIESFTAEMPGQPAIAAIAIGPGTGAEGQRNVFFVDTQRLVSRLAADFKAPKEIYRNGFEFARQLETVARDIGSEEWMITAPGAVLGATNDGLGEGRPRSVLSAVQSLGALRSYQVVLKDGRRIPVSGETRELVATKAVVPFEHGFALLDKEGTVWRLTLAASDTGSLRMIAALPGAGCALAGQGAHGIFVAGGNGGVLVADASETLHELFPVDPNERVCAVGLDSDAGVQYAVRWVTAGGIWVSQPCRDCTALRTIDENLDVLNQHLKGHFAGRLRPGDGAVRQAPRGSATRH
jgi:Novel STAND NTPase 1